ncbi:chromosome segregation protein SMC [candidate division KSB1 bacterium]
MFLSQVELVGFKSFAHKTKVVFDEGITAIVGPNGCGKTNIVDAIRWVLGEQKTTVLRSDRMESVIFSGTQNRRRLGFAEVSLLIENTKNILPSEYSQVLIGRRLYRSGESDYLLNKQVCRLKDITNLLMDSGMGPDAYSVIELSMVELILNDRDDYRKKLFEEAAGITKYKARRHEALRKLNSTRQDLIRVKDIIVEVDRGVNSLRNQVNKAKRYEKVKSQLMIVEKQYFACRRHDLLKRIKPLENKRSEFANSLSEVSGQISKQKAVIDKFQVDILEKQQNLAGSQDKLNKFSERVRETDSNHAKMQERVSALNETIIRLEEEIKLYKNKIVENEYNIKDTGKKISENKDLLSGISSELDKLKISRDTFLAEYKEKKAVYRARNQEVFDIIKLLEEKNREKYTIIRDTEERKKLKGRLEESKDKSSLRKNQLAEQLKNKQKEFKDLSSQLDQYTAGKKSLKDEIEVSFEKITGYDNKVNSLNLSLESLKTKSQFLNQLVEEFEGIPGGVSAILKNRSNLKGVLGSLGELISVPKEFRAAVEAALGDQAHYIVIDKWDNIKKAVEFLRANNSGKVTFLALDKVPEIKSADKTGMKKEYSLLSDKITCEKELSNLIDVLFGNVLYSDNENLSKIDSKDINTSYAKIVNKNGEMISIGFLYSGGTISDDSSGLLGRKDRIIELEKEINAAETEKNKIINLIKQESETKVLKENKLSELEIKITGLTSKLDSTKQALNLANFELNQLVENLESVESELKQIDLFGDKGVFDKLDEEIDKLQKEHDRLQEDREQFQKEEEALDNDRQVIEQQYSEKNLHYTRIEETIRSLENEYLRLRNSQTEYETEINNRKKSLSETKESIKTSTLKIDNLQSELNKLFNEQKDYEDKVLKNREELNVVQEESKGEFDNFLELQKRSESVQEEIGEIKENISEIHHELKFLEETYSSKGIKPEDFEDIDVDVDIEEIITHKQAQIRKMETFGPVNLEALDEYEKEHERLEFLKNQSKDLEEAENTLLETIDKINTTARERFLQTFQLVRQNFINIFSTLFANGTADMVLVEGDDPLESKIEIFAQPFGKRITNIALLSGGEKALTAIAILFAIYRVKPSPFCILDEVDAPLDDANIERFIMILNEFSKDTQFVVVTHNKKTMKSAKNLYGVTMEETGISKLVSVKMNETNKEPSEV